MLYAWRGNRMPASNCSEWKTLSLKSLPEQGVPKPQGMFAPTNPFPKTCLLKPVPVLRIFLRVQYFLAFFWECVVLLCLQCAKKLLFAVCKDTLFALCKDVLFAVCKGFLVCSVPDYFVFRVGLYFMLGVRIYFVCSACYFARCVTLCNIWLN